MTKTMQPVLPKLFSLEELSPEWWHKMRQETNQAIEEMIVRRGDRIKHIAVDFQESEYTMNKQGEWDCTHASMCLEEFLADLDLNSDLLIVEVCTACKRYYDERDEEWKY